MKLSTDMSTVLIADVDECTTNPRTCLVGRCVNSYGGHYCLSNDAIGKQTSFISFRTKIGLPVHTISACFIALFLFWHFVKHFAHYCDERQIYFKYFLTYMYLY